MKNKIMPKQNTGFAAVPLIIFIVVLLVLFFGGLYILQRIRENQQEGNVFSFSENAAVPNGNEEKFISGNDSTAEQITIYANNQTGKANPLVGFLLGVTYDSSKNYDKTIELLYALKPRFWRFSNHSNNIYGFVQKGNFVKKYNTELMFVIEDAVIVEYGYDLKISPQCPNGKPNCFKSFDDFRSAWAAVTTGVMNEMVRGNYPFKYFEVFGEPINAGFGQVLNSGTGISGITPDQLMELYKVSHNIIRSIKPDAKVGGPGWITYGEKFLSGFLDYIVKENLSLDFFSWHEFGAPEDVAVHVAEARQLISARPKLCNPNCPEIHITEFSPSNQMHIPATGLAWFYYLEKANVDGANRACSDAQDPSTKWSTCWEEFNGMFHKDTITTPDMYWVYRMYADMDNERVRTDVTNPHTVAISARDDSQKELKVLVGRYGYKGAAGDVKIDVKDYPFGNAKVSAEIWKVPANGKLYHVTALKNPIQIKSQELDVINGEITLNIGSFKDGEVYYLIFKPI